LGVARLPTDEEVQRMLSRANVEDYRSTAYSLGTYYAGILRNMAEREGRIATAKHLVASLGNIQKIWAQAEHKRKLSTKVIYEILNRKPDGK